MYLPTYLGTWLHTYMRPSVPVETCIGCKDAYNNLHLYGTITHSTVRTRRYQITTIHLASKERRLIRVHNPHLLLQSASCQYSTLPVQYC